MSSKWYFVLSIFLVIISLYILSIKGYFAVSSIEIVTEYPKKDFLQQDLTNEFVLNKNIYNLNKEDFLKFVSKNSDNYGDIKDLKIKRNYFTKKIKIYLFFKTPFAKILNKKSYYVSTEGEIFISDLETFYKKNIPTFKLAMANSNINSFVLSPNIIKFVLSLNEYPNLALEIVQGNLIISFNKIKFPSLVLNLDTFVELSDLNMADKLNYLLRERPQEYNEYDYLEVLSNKVVLKKSL